MLKQRIFIDVFRIDNNCVKILLILVFNPSSIVHSMGDTLLLNYLFCAKLLPKKRQQPVLFTFGNSFQLTVSYWAYFCDSCRGFTRYWNSFSANIFYRQLCLFACMQVKNLNRQRLIYAAIRQHKETCITASKLLDADYFLQLLALYHGQRSV